MYLNQDIYEYLQKLSSFLESQTAKMHQMEAEIESLHGTMELLKNQRQITIERIEYKFDQLKVETLEGTLNIGITPQGMDSIEEFVVNQSGQKAELGISDTDDYQNIRFSIYHYLDHDVPQELKLLGEQYHYPIEPELQGYVIEDLKKQVDGRIQEYLNQSKANHEDQQISQDQIIQILKRDIREGLSQFIKRIPK